MVTKDSWTVFLYNLRDSSNPYSATIFSVFLILIGSFFLVNVILAVIMEKFSKVQNFEDEVNISPETSDSSNELSIDEIDSFEKEVNQEK